MHWPGRLWVLFVCSIPSLFETTHALPNSVRGGPGALQSSTDETHETESDIRVVGGQSVPNNWRYSYYSLLWQRSICGGALIAPHYVVTAAHCQNASDGVYVGFSSRHIRLNDSEFIEIAEVIVHPDYIPGQFPNDIALLRLATPATKAYIRLNNNAAIPSTDVSMTVLGMGDTDNDPNVVEIPLNLQYVDQLYYVENEQCDAMYEDNDITPDMLCAAGDGRDACGGDSGGPLIIQGASVEQDLLVGIVTWGRGCALPSSPGVYARVSYFYEWMMQEMCNRPFSIPNYLDCESIDLVSATPTIQPTIQSETPSTFPTHSPSNIPSDAPSLVPSLNPTDNPTRHPSSIPSDAPSLIPSLAPSDSDVTDDASGVPSDAPSLIPSSYASPDDGPTASNQSNIPSDAPSLIPSAFPSPRTDDSSMDYDQSKVPSDAPSLIPSYSPPNPSPVAVDESTGNSASPSLSFAPSTLPELEFDFLGWLGAPDDAPLTRCQGDCDLDSDCAGDLVCFQRTRGESVAGCFATPNTHPAADFCVRSSDRDAAIANGS